MDNQKLGTMKGEGEQIKLTLFLAFFAQTESQLSTYAVWVLLQFIHLFGTHSSSMPLEKLAKKNNRSVNNYIETLLFDAVGYHEPNKVTKQAIKEIETQKKSLKRYSNVEDLFKDLENE